MPSDEQNSKAQTLKKTLARLDELRSIVVGYGFQIGFDLGPAIPTVEDWIEGNESFRRARDEIVRLQAELPRLRAEAAEEEARLAALTAEMNPIAKDASAESLVAQRARDESEHLEGEIRRPKVEDAEQATVTAEKARVARAARPWTIATYSLILVAWAASYSPGRILHWVILLVVGLVAVAGMFRHPNSEFARTTRLGIAFLAALFTVTYSPLLKLADPYFGIIAFLDRPGWLPELTFDAMVFPVFVLFDYVLGRLPWFPHGDEFSMPIVSSQSQRDESLPARGQRGVTKMAELIANVCVVAGAVLLTPVLLTIAHDDRYRYSQDEPSLLLGAALAVGLMTIGVLIFRRQSIRRKS